MASTTSSQSRISWLVFGCALAFPAVLFPACSGNAAAGLCRDACDCEGCSESEEEDCIEAAEDAQADAEDEGCTEEFDAYVECVESGFKCDDGDAVYTETCSSEAEDLNDCGGTTPSAGNVCDQAVKACGASEGGEQVQCTGSIQCQAKCIVDYDCDVQSDAFVECISEC